MRLLHIFMIPLLILCSVKYISKPSSRGISWDLHPSNTARFLGHFGSNIDSSIFWWYRQIKTVV